ncbi:MAG: GNAT family N-acetyltransferase [SAR202 cluster bacterium]|jgi:GNAT superfamily N-acetyltransferase|nr:GNAT family N-acetyltransferase [SAR202 cluster bacterium]MDP6513094.1 GNAT family N-acetyltransferase [SAR202 cluster bacterium]MDP6716038.1 GNAT family N-acetyltransferase [SAR202 cluster bacterium]
MTIIRQATSEELNEYAKIPMTVLVESIFKVDIIDSGFGGFQLSEQPVKNPWLKNYDDEGDDTNVAGWLEQFDVTNWSFLLAEVDGRIAGGATIASRTDGVHMLDSRDDLGVLWDLRVSDAFKRQGVGAALFRAAVDWQSSEGLKQVKIETQNVNVPACRFYAAMGCELRGIIHHSYAADGPPVDEEVQFHWWLDL